MTELSQRLRGEARNCDEASYADWGLLMREAAETIERLTAENEKLARLLSSAKKSYEQLYGFRWKPKRPKWYREAKAALTTCRGEE
ncbi:MAG: hypothetical protein KAI73_10670 [Rhodospirillaceae bacterium]|nr:hypothetical protein [Rhodospirillaceae bacterium]